LTHNQVKGLPKSGTRKYTETEKEEAFKQAKEIGVTNAAEKLSLSFFLL
jgi:hypothetical protein